MVFCEGSWGGRDWTVEWVRWLPCKLIQVPSPASSLVPPKRYVIPEQKTGVRPEQVWSINHRSFWEDKAKNKAEIRKRKTVNQIISVFSRIPITDAHSGQKQQKLIPNFQESWHWEGGGGERRNELGGGDTLMEMRCEILDTLCYSKLMLSRFCRNKESVNISVFALGLGSK